MFCKIVKNVSVKNVRLGQLSQRAFQFGDRHLDGVEVRAVGRQVSDRAVFPDQDFRHFRAFVSLEIVEHDDVALLQSRQEMVLEPGFEGLGVHGAVVGLGATTPHGTIRNSVYGLSG